ncbi:MAG: DNRLRE domain-containing protein [Deltaproteobacteria bacterium]|nr:MAG: DNRLRE domain-containing protein [Deltaproteobacteria bacterium]
MRRWGSALLLAFVLSIPAGTVRAQPCFTPLVGFGPIDPADGFPLYYQDSTGLALAECLDAVCGGVGFVLPNPNLPLSFPDNFPVEVFYSRAISKMTVGTISATYVAALEGSFANGSVVLAGDQVVFTRVRVRILGAAPGATYTVTHPYGVEVLQADTLGTVNFTQDSPRVPVSAAGPNLAFSQSIVSGRVGPFLTAVAPPAPAGLVGNPAANQTITGSPCATNIFRIVGPGFPPGGQQTDQFSTIIGKIAHVCGNGVLDLGEQCDDGNLVAGDCCSPLCQFEPTGQACANNICISGSTCDGAGACVGGAPNTAPCNDGNACTTADTCAGGVCVGGPAPNCNDGNVCTTDTCDPATGCVNTNNTSTCDDGNACTTADTCSGGQCIGGPPLNCNDGTVCTTDSCNPATGCVNTPANLPCPVATVIADAFVNFASPTTNAGTSKVLTADASPIKRTFVRISVSGVNPRTVASATLHLQVAAASGSNSNSGGQIHAVSNCSWGEKTITWNNQPVMGPVLSTVGGPVALNQGVDFDIRSAVQGDGVYCFAIDSTSTDNVNYNSREATSGKPSVAIVAAPDCGTCGAVPPTTTTTLPPPPGVVGSVVADTYVQSDLATTNFGTKPQIFVDNGTATNPGTTGVQHTFLRVTVSGVGIKHVSSAHLQLQVASVTNSGSVTGGSIHVISNCTWGETTVTWNTQPAVDGPALATLGAVAAGQIADFDVTSAIPGDGTYCFAIDTTSTDSAIYNSREGTGTRPALALQVIP